MSIQFFIDFFFSTLYESAKRTLVIMKCFFVCFWLCLSRYLTMTIIKNKTVVFKYFPKIQMHIVIWTGVTVLWVRPTLYLPTLKQSTIIANRTTCYHLSRVCWRHESLYTDVIMRPRSCEGFTNFYLLFMQPAWRISVALAYQLWKGWYKTSMPPIRESDIDKILQAVDPLRTWDCSSQIVYYSVHSIQRNKEVYLFPSIFLIYCDNVRTLWRTIYTKWTDINNAVILHICNREYVFGNKTVLSIYHQ